MEQERSRSLKNVTPLISVAEMNMDLDLNQADFQICNGFGLQLDLINSA